MRLRWSVYVTVFFFVAFAVFYFPATHADAAGKGVTVVGLYSETDAGHVSYRSGGGNWIVAKLGDQIPENAEIGITVDRDFVELTPSDNPAAVYEITGDPKGAAVTKKVADLLKEKPKTVSFPKGAKDPKFVNKVVVKQYLGRQRFQKNGNADWSEIRYGDVLGRQGTVNIIGINNTLILVLPNGNEKKVIGPLRFTIEKLLKGENLYKYLNVTK